MLKLELAGDRNSILSATSIGTEYSIDDIDQVLAEPVTNEKVFLPVVEANTSSIDPIQDELQVFVQQDASRTERIKKRYSSGMSATPAMSNDKEPSECGSSRRPSMRGFNSSSDCSIETSQKVAQLSQFPSTRSTGRLTWPCRSAECANTNDNEAVLHSNQISSFGERCDTIATATASASATSEFATDANRAEFESTWSTRTADRPQQRAAKVDAAAAAFTRYDWHALEPRPFHLWTETEAAASSSSDRRNSAGSQLDPHYAAGRGSRRGSNASTSKTKPNISALSNDAAANAGTHTCISAPHACGWSRSATNAADETQLGTSATYPIQTAWSSAVSVSHHQPPAVQLPGPAVGSALRAHLLGTRGGHRESPLSQACRSASASSQFSLYAEPACTPVATSAAAAFAFAFAPHRRPRSQQITPAAKGTRTSDVSSAAATSSYDQQPRTNAQAGAPYSTSGTCPNAATAWQCGTRSDLRVLGQPVEFIPPNYPVARQSSALPNSAFNSSPTPLELQNRSVRYPTTERVVDATTYTYSYDGQNYAKPTRQTAASDPLVARPIIVSQNRVGISFATTTSGSSSFHPPQLRVSDPSSIV